MIRIRLSESDAQLLEDEYRRCKDASHRVRLQIIRLAARDRPHQQIRVSPRFLRKYALRPPTSCPAFRGPFRVL